MRNGIFVIGVVVCLSAFLRARHLPFPIGTSVRDQWLTCMLMAMQDLGLAEDKQDVLLQAFFKTADWMRNQGS